MQAKKRFLKEKDLLDYFRYLKEQEKSRQTIEKYKRDLYALWNQLKGGQERNVDKEALIIWKEQLLEKYASSSVNGKLAALNGFLSHMEWGELKIKPVRIQRTVFASPEKELTKAEYQRLVIAAGKMGNERLSLIIQTICGTGIRVSELPFITVDAVKNGRTEVSCKGKRRIIFLPERLRHLLNTYIGKHKKTNGAVFTTKKGKPIDRSNIWRDMKALCKDAMVDSQKVFPHNLRHLFARTFYSLEKDISRLADILGHSNVVTTRIYTMESGMVHARQMERMGLIIT